MDKPSAFNEAKPRTPKAEARQRENRVMKAMAELSELADEAEYQRILAEIYGIVPGHPRYEKAMTTWRELQRGRT